MGIAGSRRAQSDIDRLFVFVVGIVVFLLVVPVVLGLAGIDVRDAELDGDGSAAPDDSEPLVVLAAYGTAVDEQRTSIGVVELVVGGTGEADVDLSELTVTWMGAESYELVPADQNVGDASFAVDVISGDAVLAEPSDRAIVRFDLGTDDADGIDHFGERLRAGDAVDLTLTTDDGETTRVTATVPSPLPGGAGVRFDVRPR